MGIFFPPKNFRLKTNPGEKICPISKNNLPFFTVLPMTQRVFPEKKSGCGGGGFFEM